MDTPAFFAPVIEGVKARALEIWREREAKFPERVRRMTPDEIDYATGAWLSCLLAAIREGKASYSSLARDGEK